MTETFKIPYSIYRNRTSYNDNQASMSGPLKVDKNYLLSILCKYGGFKNISLSRKSENLYTAYIDFIFDKTSNADNSYKLSRNLDYRESESSFMGQLSFIHGMITSIILAEYHLGVNMLLHLTDERLVVTGEKSPDYFGTKYNGNPLLLEAKGSVGKVSDTTLDNAEKQLNSITEVIDRKNGTNISTYRTFLKYISTSNFNNNGDYYINLIDPISYKGENIAFDFDEATYFHYNYIFDYIHRNYDEAKIEKLNNISYICASLDEITIGIDEKIFNLLWDYNSLSDPLFEKINNIQGEFYSWDNEPPEYLNNSDYKINNQQSDKDTEKLDGSKESKGKNKDGKNNRTEDILLNKPYKQIDDYIVNRDGTCVKLT